MSDECKPGCRFCKANNAIVWIGRQFANIVAKIWDAIVRCFLFIKNEWFAILATLVILNMLLAVGFVATMGDYEADEPTTEERIEEQLQKIAATDPYVEPKLIAACTALESEGFDGLPWMCLDENGEPYNR